MSIQNKYNRLKLRSTKDLSEAHVRITELEKQSDTLQAEIEELQNNSGGGGSTEDYFVVQIDGHFYSETASATFWKYCLGSDYTQNGIHKIATSTGSVTFAANIPNRIQDSFISPFNCKLKSAKLTVQQGAGGILSFGIAKYNRADAVYYFDNNLSNIVTLLEQNINGGVSTTFQYSYIEEWASEIADVVIAENERMAIFMKDTQTVINRNVPFNLTLIFKRV